MPPTKLRSTYPSTLAAANNTVWNLRMNPKGATGTRVPLPACDFGPLLNFVGNWGRPAATVASDAGEDRRRLLQDPAADPAYWGLAPAPAVDESQMLVEALADPPAGYQQFPGSCAREGWYVETSRMKERLLPADLHAAMVETRAQRLGAP